MTARRPFDRIPEPDFKTPTSFKLWFAFCAILGVGFLVIVVWLVIAAIGWLNRH